MSPPQHQNANHSEYKAPKRKQARGYAQRDNDPLLSVAMMNYRTVMNGVQRITCAPLMLVDHGVIVHRHLDHVLSTAATSPQEIQRLVIRCVYHLLKLRVVRRFVIVATSTAQNHAHSIRFLP